MIDAYELFMNKFNIKEDDLIDFGLRNTHSIDIGLAEKEWNIQKENIINGGEVIVRTFGNKNDARTKSILLNFYKNVYPKVTVETDRDGNTSPRELLERLTQKKKNKDIINFQISHIFGQTKNLYAFTAPWNIVFMPKIMDPLTGHEAHGDLKNRFQSELQKMIYNKYEDLIHDFNSLMNNEQLVISIDNYLNSINEKRFKKEIKKDFSEISLICK